MKHTLVKSPSQQAAIYKVFAILFLALSVVSEYGQAQPNPEPTKQIEPYFGLSNSAAERDSMQENLDEFKLNFETIHKYELGNNVPMALQFDPYPAGFKPEPEQLPLDWGLPATVQVPADRARLAYYPVYKLAVLIKQKKVTSTELTQLYLSRLKKFGDTLQCVITLLEEQALRQAKKADEEIAAGIYRGPLHGIPYGIKDLLAVRGTKTTWGAMPYKDQVIEETASVVNKLNEAGAVLIAKLTMGALAMGDIWYGGVTKNPWDLTEGSSGSSAGSAAATAAGLVAFAIGTETWGSIVSPSTRCGTTGLRPTFGLVSRHGAMALCWSMDKIGPICRSALDCALVFNTIRGTDGKDLSVRDAPFNYNARSDIRKLRVGYVKDLFEKDTTNRSRNQKVLDIIAAKGIKLEPVALPDKIPVSALAIILGSEAAAAFDELTRSGEDSLLVNQRKSAWPNFFRAARFIPAVEYVNANRIRQLLIEEYYRKTKDYDVIVAPSFEGDQLLMTNLTGHPCLVIPDGFDEKGNPTSISFLGKLQGEAALITLGRAIQEATDWDDRNPPLFN
jgi:Asp-tRNA(Asn)/Glu-tRNA(Gln) amidotransferase A subunit family amidase